EAHRQSPPPRRLRKRIRSQGPFLHRNYPTSQVVRPCPTPARSAAKHTASKPRPPTARVSPDYPHHPSTVPCPLPRWIERVHLSIASPSTRPSPLFRRVGIHIFTFEACSGFTHVTARWIAQPPKAAFVTRLQPGQSPSQTARQLPDQSTTLWVESSSTGDTRLRGAQNKNRTPLGFWQENVDFGDFQASLRMTGPRPSDAVTPRARGSTAERLGSYSTGEQGTSERPDRSESRVLFYIVIAL